MSPQSKTHANAKRRRRIRIAAVTAGVLVLAVAAVAIYLDRVAPFRATVITVNDKAISMRTFLRRTRIAGEDPMVMLDVLVDEEIVNQVAPYPPYDIEVTDSDVDSYLRAVAAAPNASMEDAEYSAWYRRQVNDSLMSERDFREFVRARILKTRFRDHLAERVPTVSEQVRLSMAAFGGIDSTREARARIEAGEAFADVVADSSTDPNARQSGGDLGWQARGGLSPQIARVAFDRLDPGEISEPYFVGEDTFALIMVAERAAARELDGAARHRVQERALEYWLDEEEENHTIEYHGFDGGGYDAATDAWVRWQLDRMAE
jgi:parvulin-like peptidyl-prolyl isomerase